MARDERYKNVKNLIESGRITALREIFSYKAIPKTVVAKDMGMHHVTFNKLLAAPQRFTFENAFHLAALLDTDKKNIISLIDIQCEEDRKKARKK
jgi:plasmid maintenance system antidote protein VapI